MAQAAMVTRIDTQFQNQGINVFPEFKYFVNVVGAFDSIGGNTIEILSGNSVYGLTLPPKLNRIWSFGLSGVKQVTIPPTITTIQSYIFRGLGAYGIADYEEVIFESETPCSFNQNPFGHEGFGGSLDNLKIFVPDNSIQAYKEATNMDRYSSRIFGISQYGKV